MRKITYKNYDVYEDGRIFSIKSKKIMSPFLDTMGRYKYIDLNINGKRERWSVHRLVAKLFIPNPYNLSVVGHINADVTDNHYSNLKWITQKENIHQSYIDSGVDATRNFKECYLVTPEGIVGEFKSIECATKHAVSLGAKSTMINKHRYHNGIYIVKKV